MRLSDLLYIVGSIFFCAVFIKQIMIISNSTGLSDIFFWSKIIFLVFNFSVMVGFGLAMMTNDFISAGWLYVFISVIAFWAYYLKKPF